MVGVADPQRLALRADPKVPALTVMLGSGVLELLNTALDPVGGRCESARTSQVRYVPSKSVIAQYEARVKWENGATTTETFVTTAGVPVPESTPVLEAGDVSIAIWRFPNDPFLPGLAAATDPERVRRLLARLGTPAGKVRLRRRAYRPGRRAVIEAVTPRARIFVKVVRPDRVAALQEKHSSMSGHVPVPHSYGWSEELGLVALQAMPGKTLRKALEAGTRRLPIGPQFINLLASLPEPGTLAARIPGAIDQAPTHAKLLKAVTPELADRIDGVIEALGTVGKESPVPVHGDFHSSQVMVRGPDIIGLLDVDTTGVGERANDLAGMIGHLSTLSLASPVRRMISRYGADLIAEFDRERDPISLRLRTAAVALGLATGPFRVQEPNWPTETERRIALAEKWIESASAVAG